MQKIFTLMKKVVWQCYALTSILLVVVLVWGLSGRLGGGGHAFRLLNFYAIIPGTLFIFGGFLGFKDARWKWVYPILFGILMRLVVLQFARLQVGMPLFGFIFAFSGMLIGVIARIILQKMSVKWQSKTKKTVIIFATISCAIILVHAVHALTLDRIIEYREVTFSSPNLPAELHGYKIAFITDAHGMPSPRLQEVVDELNRREIDLLLLGGDFYHAHGDPWRSMSILSQTITTDGIFGVEGNHDRHAILFEAKRENGIVPLSNSGVLLRDGFFLAGVEDMWNRNPCIATATEGASHGDFVLLLSHNPDISMQQDTTNIDLILSGHTHGGQVTFFGIWAPYFTFWDTITSYGQRFTSGWAVSRDGAAVFVSNGMGEYLPRVWARPQVVLITLTQ